MRIHCLEGWDLNGKGEARSTQVLFSLPQALICWLL